ncbi:enolase C-terminal domain-like protein [Streptomyces iconiensis]|uniref:Enolase C-terminal domain-like protein n=1 Tax=Streptomyces iconiensis TaxID=1384038 RepID=A0ABT6ZT11_9ACTN|nr:enolase C-terminal domain-like protein [Streptomyces iconiensis]MDJ1132195.1 enolase C-terminal domain-like protein [Streptomyces iconiensis]
MGGPEARVEDIGVHAFRVPTDGPGGVEEDGTLRWEATTVIVVQAYALGRAGLGYTYGDASVGDFVHAQLAPVVTGQDALAPAATSRLMSAAVRNAGRPGVGAMAVSAVDLALWDLKARLLEVPLYRTLPAFHDRVPVYGSGGFTNYPVNRLAEQLGAWVGEGIPRVKLKISRHPAQDPGRLDAVRQAIGHRTELFTDANGALGRKEAQYWAGRLAEEWDVRWLEEPVSSEDTVGLRRVRESAPGRIEVAAGEYGYLLGDFTALLDGGAVDCLQADVTRCGGITGLLRVAGSAAAHGVDLSAHCAPAASTHAFCAVERLRHLEYFHDHVRVERLVFDGAVPPVDGVLRPSPERPGLGLEVRWADAEPYRVRGSRPGRPSPPPPSGSRPSPSPPCASPAFPLASPPSTTPVPSEGEIHG